MRNRILEEIGFILLVVIWLIGMVLAHGFWSTFFSILFPPWGWYIIVFTLFSHWGII